MLSLSGIGFMSYFDLDAVNHNAKSFHRVKLLFSNALEVTCEFCMSSMDNDFHKANNVTTRVKM
jgi:hypothetical protein